MAYRKATYRLRQGPVRVLLWLSLVAGIALLLGRSLQYTASLSPAPSPLRAYAGARYQHSFPHARRAIASWPDSITKGKNLVCAMEQPLDAPHALVQQSTWTQSDLDKHGWTTTSREGRDFPRPGDFDDFEGLEAAFEALGVSTDPEDWLVASVKHSQDTREGDIEYPATSGYYDTLWQVKPAGTSVALIVKNSYSPKYMASSLGLGLTADGPKRVTPLNRWSDVVWLVWQQLTSNQPDLRPTLEHVFRHNIHNADSLAIIRRAQRGGTESTEENFPPGWPGWTFSPTENPEGFNSILSAPNSFGIAFFLASHKRSEQFKVKTIDKLQAFNCPDVGEDQMCLYMHVAAVGS